MENIKGSKNRNKNRKRNIDLELENAFKKEKNKYDEKLEEYNKIIRRDERVRIEELENRYGLEKNKLVDEICNYIIYN